MAVREKCKVVILCGGKGTRLREETEFRPKPLVKIGNMPILWHIMKTYSYYGYNDFILCLGYKGDMIKDYFLNFEEMTNDFTLSLRSNTKKIVHHNTSHLEDWRITFVDTGQEAQTGARIARIKDYLPKNQPFFLTYGDGVSDIPIAKLMQFHKESRKIATVAGVHSISVFGLIEHNNGLVKTFREKPMLEDIISGGYFVANTSLFDYVQDRDDCVFEDKPLKQLVKDKELALYKHNGFWYCMDTQKHVEELNRIWQSGKAPWQVWKN